MSKYAIESTTLTAIGDAVREKTGTEDLIPVPQLASKILEITGGGSSGGGINVNGELKTVTAKTAVSKGDMVQYSENSFTLSRFQNLADINGQSNPDWKFATYPWGISWLKNGQGIFWCGVSDTSIQTYVLTKNPNGIVSCRWFGTWAVKDSNTSFLDWVLLDDNKTVRPIAISMGSDGYTYIGSGYKIDITNGHSNYSLQPSGESASQKRIGSTTYYRGVLNCKSKTIETDTQYKIYIAGNYQRTSSSGAQYCNCVYVDKATGDVSFDTMLIGSFGGFGNLQKTDNMASVIMDVQEIDESNHSYCTFISCTSSNKLYIHQRSDGSTSQKRILFNYNNGNYNSSVFLARKSISDPVMWAYVNTSTMQLNILRWDKDKKEPVIHQDAITLTKSAYLNTNVYLKKFSDNLYMVIGGTGSNESNPCAPSLYLYWDMETYTMSILGTISGKWTQESNTILDITNDYVYYSTIELFPNITHLGHLWWLKGADKNHPQMFRHFQNELIKLDDSLDASIHNFNHIVYFLNVLKYVTVGDGQHIKLHNNDFAFEPVNRSNIQVFTIDNTPTIGNLLASDNPTGFAVAAEDIPAGGTGQAYVI